MPTVWFNRTDSSSVEVSNEEIAQYALDHDLDVDDVDVIDVAYDKFTFPPLCTQCSGWGQDYFVDVGEWEADENVEV